MTGLSQLQNNQARHYNFIILTNVCFPFAFDNRINTLFYQFKIYEMAYTVPVPFPLVPDTPSFFSFFQFTELAICRKLFFLKGGAPSTSAVRLQIPLF